MSSSDAETARREKEDEAAYDRLKKDLAAVKADIAALTQQITDTLAGAARQQARQGYKQARANADSAVGDLAERGGAAVGAAQDAAKSIEETLENVIVQRPLATVALALGAGLLIGMTWRR